VVALIPASADPLSSRHVAGKMSDEDGIVVDDIRSSPVSERCQKSVVVTAGHQPPLASALRDRGALAYAGCHVLTLADWRWRQIDSSVSWRHQ
jgi:hypothetical protein